MALDDYLPGPRFDTPSPVAGSTFVRTPGNVQETDAAGNVMNFKPFEPMISNSPAVFDPASVIGPPPTANDPRGSFFNDDPHWTGNANNGILTVREANRRKHSVALAPHDEALSKAKEYYDLASHVTDQHTKAKTFTDSADFLTKLSTVERTDPEFERKFAEIAAAHPYADGQLVQSTVQSKLNARKTFTDALQHGGASEFGSEDNQTPEYHAYKRAIHETKDPAQARAAAIAAKEGEKTISDAVAKGVFNVDQDLPAWQPQWATKADKTRPKIYNPDGSINYSEAGKIIAKKTGAGEGTKATLDLAKNSTAAAEKFLSIHKDKPDPEIEPELFKNWHAANSIIIRTMRSPDATLRPGVAAVSPSATPTGLPAVTPAPTSAKRYTQF